MRRLLLRSRPYSRRGQAARRSRRRALTIGLLRATRYFDPIKTANLFGRSRA